MQLNVHILIGTAHQLCNEAKGHQNDPKDLPKEPAKDASMINLASPAMNIVEPLSSKVGGEGKIAMLG